MLCYGLAYHAACPSASLEQALAEMTTDSLIVIVQLGVPLLLLSGGDLLCFLE